MDAAAPRLFAGLAPAYAPGAARGAGRPAGARPAAAASRGRRGAGPVQPRCRGRCWRRRRCTVHCRRSSRWPRRLLDPRGDRGVERGGGDPGLRGAGRAAERRRDPDRAPGRVRLARRRPRASTRTIRGWCRPPRSCGWRATRRWTSGWCRCATGTSPGPRYAGQAASGMPLQEAILRMTVDTEQSAGRRHRRVHRAVAAGRAGRRRRDRDRRGRPSRSRTTTAPTSTTTTSTRTATCTRRGRDEFVYPEWDHRAGRYLADWCLVRLGRPKPVRSDRRHRRALARHGHLLPGLVSQLERVRPAGRDARAPPAVRRRPRPGRLRGRDRRPAHRHRSPAPQSTPRCGKAPRRRGRAGDRPQLVHRRAAAARPGRPTRVAAHPRPAARRGQPADRGAGAGRRRLRHLRLLRRRPRRRAAVGGQGPRRAARRRRCCTGWTG